MFGAGDEGVRTDINRTYTVRRGSVIVRFTGPRSQRVPRAARMIGLQGESTVANAMSQRTRAAEARRVAVLLLALTGMLLLVRYLSID